MCLALDALSLHCGSSCLLGDFGCGTGWVLAHALFAVAPRPVWGIDLAVAPLVPFLRALKRSGRPHLPVFYREGDIDSILSVDGLHVVFCFGAAFLESTLHHIVKLCSKTSSVHDIVWVARDRRKQKYWIQVLDDKGFTMTWERKCQMRKGKQWFWMFIASRCLRYV